MKVKDIKLNQ
jgi:hypothetical protein